MTKQTKAEAAPATVTVTDDAAAAELRRREDEARRVKPVQVMPPPPAPGMAQEEDRQRQKNPQAWLDRPIRESWLVESAADTKAAVMSDMAQAMLARFNADAALAAGGAVSVEWLNSQILTYQLPITEDEVREAAKAAFGEAGIQVQG